jgi:ssDNA-binding replication factor A large subunit
MATWNPEGSLHFEKTDKYSTGRIKGDWEDALKSEIPGANERAWNQGAEEVTDGKVDSQSEVKAVGDWYRQKLADQKQPKEAPALAPAPKEDPVKDSSHLAEAKERVKEWENKSWSGERANEIFSPSNEQALSFDATTAPTKDTYDARPESTGLNKPDDNAVLNAYKKEFAKNFSPDGLDMTKVNPT